jgi:hypothetical protein
MSKLLSRLFRGKMRQPNDRGRDKTTTTMSTTKTSRSVRSPIMTSANVCSVCFSVPAEVLDERSACFFPVLLTCMCARVCAACMTKSLTTNLYHLGAVSLVCPTPTCGKRLIERDLVRFLAHKDMLQYMRWTHGSQDEHESSNATSTTTTARHTTEVPRKDVNSHRPSRWVLGSMWLTLVGIAWQLGSLETVMSVTLLFPMLAQFGRHVLHSAKHYALRYATRHVALYTGALLCALVVLLHSWRRRRALAARLGNLSTLMWKRFNTRACPGVRCGVATERSSGCKHMTCTQCRTHWCWECNKQFTQWRPQHTCIPLCASSPRSLSPSSFITTSVELARVVLPIAQVYCHSHRATIYYIWTCVLLHELVWIRRVIHVGILISTTLMFNHVGKAMPNCREADRRVIAICPLLALLLLVSFSTSDGVHDVVYVIHSSVPTARYVVRWALDVASAAAAAFISLGPRACAIANDSSTLAPSLWWCASSSSSSSTSPLPTALTTPMTTALTTPMSTPTISMPPPSMWAPNSTAIINGCLALLARFGTYIWAYSAWATAWAWTAVDWYCIRQALLFFIHNPLVSICATPATTYREIRRARTFNLSVETARRLRPHCPYVCARNAVHWAIVRLGR